MKAKGGCVFVHCHAGISRSATISISYIMKTMDYELSKAYEFVKQKRPCISPNLHFMGQLLEFEKQLKEQRLVEGTNTTTTMDCTAESNVQSPFPFQSNQCQPFTATSPFQVIPALKHCITPVKEECDSFFCSNTSALPSASAPSSLNFDKVEDNVPNALVQADMMVCSSKLERQAPPYKPKTLPLFQVCQSLACDPMQLFQVRDAEENEAKTTRLPPPKPTTLPLTQVKIPSKHTGTEGPAHRLLRQRSTPVQNSASLPTTPENHFKNHAMSSSSSSLSSSSSSVRMAPYSLQNSPCRVAARLGSGPNSPFNYSYNGELSL